MKRAAFAAAALIATTLAACGGGSHALPAPASSTSSVTQNSVATAQFSLLIPNRPANASTTARRAQYVSASTLSGKIVTGSTTAELDLGVGNSLCTAVTNGRSCTVSIAAKVGAAISFTLSLYDGAFSAGTHQGTLLSSATFARAVTEGTANVAIPVVLGGSAATSKLFITQQPAAYDTSGSVIGQAVLDVYDPDGNLIAGPGSFVSSSGSGLTFTISSKPSSPGVYDQVSVNGSAYASSHVVTSAADTITFKQTAASIGAELTATPSLGAVASAWIRPTGFSSSNVEGSNLALLGDLQLAPLVDNTEGVAVISNTAVVGGLLFSDGTSNAIQSCGSVGPQRAGDFAYVAGTAWLPNEANTGTLFTLGGVVLCSFNPQFPAVTGVGVSANGGIQFLDAACKIGLMYPGVQEQPGDTASNCTHPHDIVENGPQYAVIETGTDGKDHILIFTNYTFESDLLMSFNSTVAGAATLTTEAARADGTDYIHELTGHRLWSASMANPAAITGFVTLSSSYTYVDNSLLTSGNAYSPRTMAIGADGLAYIAVSSPFNGVIAVDPDTGAVVNTLPNIGAASGQVITNVVADTRGTIYWGAGTYLMHYPSSIP